MAARVKLIERRKEIEQVEKELKRFTTINEINRAFAKTLDPEYGRTKSLTPTDEAHTENKTTRESNVKKPPMNQAHMIPATYKYFERFFTIKQKLMDAENKAKIKALIEAEKDRRGNSRAIMSEVLY